MILIIQPSPSKATNDSLDSNPTDAELASDARQWRLAFGSKLANGSHIFLGKLAARVFLASQRCAVDYLVPAILGWSCPAKITRGIVSWIAVVVSRLMMWGWCRTVKSGADKSCDPVSPQFSSGRESHCVIAASADLLFQNYLIGNGFPNTTVTAHLVPGPTFYWPPFFWYNLISHIALLRRYWSGALRRGQIRCAPRIISWANGMATP